MAKRHTWLACEGTQRGDATHMSMLVASIVYLLSSHTRWRSALSA